MSKYPGNIITTGADTGYSVFFDGTGDYLTTPSSASFSFGTGDFTIEYWVYATSGANNGMFQVSTNAGGLNASSANSVACNIFTTNSLTIYAAGSPYGTSNNKLPFNTWTHLAIVRASGVTKLYINGVLETSIGTGGAITDTTNYTGTYFAVGGYYNTSYLWNGYISNFRVLKGTALYTANFTPPTQLFNITNTSLLTCNSPAIVDQGTANSGSGFPITVNGNTAVSTFTPFTGYQAYNPALGAATPGVWTVSDALQAAATRQWNMYDPYFNYTTLKLSGNPGTNVPTWITDASTNNFAVTVNGDARAAGLSPFSLTTYPTSGSGYLDGTGDYLNLGGQSAFAFGTGDWTIEFWMNFSATGGTLFDTRPAGTAGTTGYGVLFLSSGSVRYDTAAGVKITGSTLTANTWYHVALCKASGTTRLFINGVQDGSNYTDSVNYLCGANRPIIGADGNNPATVLFTGYLSNYRIVKGTALYTTTFTPSTAPLTAVTNTSLLTLQNSQSSNNNSFLDSSSNNFLITRNGNTTQGTFTPFSQTGWSNYFDGTNSYVTFASANTANAMGAGDWTVEAWVYPTTSGTDRSIFDTYGTGSTSTNIRIRLNTSNQLTLTVASTAIASGGTVSANTWTHIAVCKASGSTRLFVNGSQVGSTYTDSNTYGCGTSRPVIGIDGSDFTSLDFVGYISNLRTVKGQALYTSTFTPSTTPLTTTSQGATASNVSLLTCQANRFLDISNGAFVATAAGTPSVQAFSPFQTNVAYTPATIGGSAYFDGAGDYLQIASNNAFAFSGDLSLECWIYKLTAWRGGDYDMILKAGGVQLGVYGYTGGRLNVNIAGVGYVCDSSIYPDLQSWNHIVVTRVSGTLRLFLNGKLVATQGNSTNLAADVARIQGDNSLYQWSGNISGVRVIKGGIPSAYSTSSTTVGTQVFTPPTAPFTGNESLTAGSVSLLCNFTNAGIVDTTGKNVLETVGNAQISTVQSKYGGSSMFFDGTGDYAYVISSAANSALGSGDWTVEFWLYTAASGTTYNVIDWRPTSTNGAYLAFYLNSGVPTVYVNTANLIVGGAGISGTTWTHIAISRSGTSTRLFVNGTQSGSTATDSTNYLGTVNRPAIGGGGFDTGSTLNGYINDLRITRGFARYTGNFTPPTSLLQNQ